MVGDPTVDVRNLALRHSFTLESIEAAGPRMRSGTASKLDEESWYAQFYIGGCATKGGISVSERWRLIYGLYESDVPRVPVDIFCYELHDGPDIALPVTKTGGRPWRRDDKPWPRREDGQPLAFIGQIRMTESRDLIPEHLRGAVGDLVLVFSDFTEPRLSQYRHTFATMSVMEWSSLSDAPSGQPLSPECKAVCYAYSFHAQRCRTVEFDRDAGREFIAKKMSSLLKPPDISWPPPHYILQYSGTKIGGNLHHPYYYGSQACFDDRKQKGKPPPPRLIDAPWFASLGSLPPGPDDSADGDPHISWGDGGHISLFMEADGQLHGEEHGQAE